MFLQDFLVTLLTLDRELDEESEDEVDDESLASDGEGSDSGSEDDEDKAETARPYLSLMRSLAESAPPKAKRRKLEHPAEASEAQQDGAEEEDPKEEIDDSHDLMEEPDEEGDEAGPDELFDDDDDLDSSDPFEGHFASPNEGELGEKLKAIEAGQWQLKRVASNPWRIFASTPKLAESTEVVLPKPATSPADLKLKQKLREVAGTQKPEFDALEGLLSSFLFNHQDTLFCERTIANTASLRWIASLHALNHVFK